MSTPPKRRKGRRPRKTGNRNLRKRFLIVCEGKQTEPNYFRAFRANAKTWPALYCSTNETLPLKVSISTLPPPFPMVKLSSFCGLNLPTCWAGGPNSLSMLPL